jgi:DMSO reductase family type II enzyme heme b subunit
MFPDAIAIQFPQQDAYSTAPVDKPLYRHGDADHHTTIWYWNAGSVNPPVEPRAVLLDASGPDNKLVVRDSSLANDLTAQGRWRHGRWRVLMKRPRNLQGGTDQDLRFTEGQFIPVSFANWDGNNTEVGSRHTLTTWYWLILPPETNNNLVYGAPLATAAGTFLLCFMVVRSQRRKLINPT